MKRKIERCARTDSSLSILRFDGHSIMLTPIVGSITVDLISGDMAVAVYPCPFRLHDRQET